MAENFAARVSLRHLFDHLAAQEISPFDFLPEVSLAEKMIGLALNDAPPFLPLRLARLFKELRGRLATSETTTTKVVVFGGGTGLSNIIGGDSRRQRWREIPFTGLKEYFPQTKSIVCVTDDGGSTGELLKDLPLIALGDLRHVLLASICRYHLKQRYDLDDAEALRVAGQLHTIFNYRFQGQPRSATHLLLESGAVLTSLPERLLTALLELTDRLFTDDRLTPTLARVHCLGNLLLASAIYAQLEPAAAQLTNDELATAPELLHQAIISGLHHLALLLGGHGQGVLPCTTTMAQLQVLYSNGVLVSSEQKSGTARRGYPVSRVQVEFFHEPHPVAEVLQQVAAADIIILAPGSLYTSIIPILQVPGLPEAIRANQQALKLLVANIWVQKGETDATPDEPERKFHLSDMIHAYHRNIPGGVRGLFSHVLSLGLGDIPGSVLQSYALEDKEPIYLDRDQVRGLGFEPIEACIFSPEMLQRQRVIQHDPESLAIAIRTLWALKSNGLLPGAAPPQMELLAATWPPPVVNHRQKFPCVRYQAITEWLATLRTHHFGEGGSAEEELNGEARAQLLASVSEIIWHHPDILLEHLEYIKGITLVEPGSWSRCQSWDNVFSFFDPHDWQIKIRQDVVPRAGRFEVAFLVALGQSLLGDYAWEKSMEPVQTQQEKIGRLFRLTLKDAGQCCSFFSHAELDSYLKLARMRRSQTSPLRYTRLINDQEGFTPPGLLFGLFYAWYLDNRFATHIEYKMSIMRNEVSNLVPEQARTVDRRQGLIRFFRETVFRHLC